MQNLISIFIRYHNFWLFLVLQAICLTLIIRTSTHHRAVFFDGIYQVSGVAYEHRSNITKYFRLQKINDSLMQENARLRESLPEAFYLNDFHIMHSRDSILKRQYSYIPARVINNSTNRPNNYITLDKGKRHNIEVPAGVITPNGIAGIITHSSAHYSAGISVLHRNFNTSARIFESGHIGTLRWNGENPDILELRDIPRHKDIETGQHVVTSPYSRLFPENISVGTILDYEINPVTNFYEIRVKANVDFRSLNYAYVIVNHMAEEQTTIEAEAERW